jgi:hypothetical protein|tara:strand:- start:408 stop:731 length:324 start_codon:yes stop_codon:yes gene_type:complete
MRHQSDYFQPLRQLERDAILFCKHQNVRDWFYYDVQQTIGEVLTNQPTDVQLMELDAMQNYLLEYTDNIIINLEGYESYETCTLVKKQRDQLVLELDEMFDAVKKLG